MGRLLLLRPGTLVSLHTVAKGLGNICKTYLCYELVGIGGPPVGFATVSQQLSHLLYSLNLVHSPLVDLQTSCASHEK